MIPNMSNENRAEFEMEDLSSEAELAAAIKALNWDYINQLLGSELLLTDSPLATELLGLAVTEKNFSQIFILVEKKVALPQPEFVALEIGQQLDVLNERNEWLEAEIIAVQNHSVTVSFIGQPAAWNEIINSKFSANRFAALSSRSSGILVNRPEIINWYLAFQGLFLSAKKSEEWKFVMAHFSKYVDIEDLGYLKELLACALNSDASEQDIHFILKVSKESINQDFFIAILRIERKDLIDWYIASHKPSNDLLMEMVNLAFAEQDFYQFKSLFRADTNIKIPRPNVMEYLLYIKILAKASSADDWEFVCEMLEKLNAQCHLKCDINLIPYALNSHATAKVINRLLEFGFVMNEKSLNLAIDKNKLEWLTLLDRKRIDAALKHAMNDHGSIIKILLERTDTNSFATELIKSMVKINSSDAFKLFKIYSNAGFDLADIARFNPVPSQSYLASLKKDSICHVMKNNNNWSEETVIARTGEMICFSNVDWIDLDAESFRVGNGLNRTNFNYKKHLLSILIRAHTPEDWKFVGEIIKKLGSLTLDRATEMLVAAMKYKVDIETISLLLTIKAAALSRVYRFTAEVEEGSSYLFKSPVEKKNERYTNLISQAVEVGANDETLTKIAKSLSPLSEKMIASCFTADDTRPLSIILSQDRDVCNEDKLVEAAKLGKRSHVLTYLQLRQPSIPLLIKLFDVVCEFQEIDAAAEMLKSIMDIVRNKAVLAKAVDAACDSTIHLARFIFLVDNIYFTEDFTKKVYHIASRKMNYDAMLITLQKYPTSDKHNTLGLAMLVQKLLQFCSRALSQGIVKLPSKFSFNLFSSSVDQDLTNKFFAAAQLAYFKLSGENLLSNNNKLELEHGELKEIITDTPSNNMLSRKTSNSNL